MDLFEYQGKQFFARYGIPVSPGDVATTVDEAVAVAERIADYPVVVKAQVQVGGRGKAGGIKLADDADSVREHATNILGMDIKGHTVERIWIEHASDIAEEYYASFTLDRSAKQHLGMLSAQGGVEIEAVAESDPDAIAKIWIDPVDGLTEDVAREWVAAAKLNPDATEGAVDILLKLYAAYVEGDADLVEINPLILTPEGKVHALDAKVTLDANAGFRHDLSEYEATQERDVREQAAHEKGLQYVGLDGSVGVIANGAGLAMSTVDIINQVGGQPANFLDIGGGASAQTMCASLEIVLSDPQVRSVLINVYGGITSCEQVALGILEAIDELNVTKPLVVRFDGNAAAEGLRILAQAQRPNIHVEQTMELAAAEAARLAANGGEETK